jgi:hypothetical protein
MHNFTPKGWRHLQLYKNIYKLNNVHKSNKRGRLITPSHYSESHNSNSNSPTLITPTVITPTLINTPTNHPGLYHHILSNRTSKQL